MNPTSASLISRTGLRALGLALAVASVVAPALPLGPLFAQPPFPLAVLWAAYGWAAEDATSWRAPVALALLGLVHDHFSAGAYGLFMALYLSSYLVGRVIAVVMSAPNLMSNWGGFAATALLSVVFAALLAPLALGASVKVWRYAEAALITTLLFPLARPLYMSPASPSRKSAGTRSPGARSP